jgi:hypothetical protein
MTGRKTTSFEILRPICRLQTSNVRVLQQECYSYQFWVASNSAVNCNRRHCDADRHESWILTTTDCGLYPAFCGCKCDLSKRIMFIASLNI